MNDRATTITALSSDLICAYMQLYQLLAGLLHLGNVKFVTAVKETGITKDSSQLADEAAKASLDAVVELW